MRYYANLLGITLSKNAIFSLKIANKFCLNIQTTEDFFTGSR